MGEPGFPSTITIGGGIGPFALAGSSGLPTGLTAGVNGRTVVFTGTPTTAGTFAKASITVEDADVRDTLPRPFSITINAAPTLGTLERTGVDWGRRGFTSGTITITGGTAPYVIAGYGSLPFTPADERQHRSTSTGTPPSQTL